MILRGFRKSFIGLWVAPIEVCLKGPKQYATRSVPICPSGERFSMLWEVFAVRLGVLGCAPLAVKRRNYALGPASIGLKVFSFTGHKQACLIAYQKIAQVGSTFVRVAIPKVYRKQ